MNVTASNQSSALPDLATLRGYIQNAHDVAAQAADHFSARGSELPADQTVGTAITQASVAANCLAISPLRTGDMTDTATTSASILASDGVTALQHMIQAMHGTDAASPMGIPSVQRDAVTARTVFDAALKNLDSVIDFGRVGSGAAETGTPGHYGNGSQC